MKPLVLYCRWQQARLRLRGRDERSVWGQLVFAAADGSESTRDFHFDLQTGELVVQQENGENRVRLDEMGIPLKD